MTYPVAQALDRQLSDQDRRIAALEGRLEELREQLAVLEGTSVAWATTHEIVQLYDGLFSASTLRSWLAGRLENGLGAHVRQEHEGGPIAIHRRGFHLWWLARGGQGAKSRLTIVGATSERRD